MSSSENDSHTTGDDDTEQTARERLLEAIHALSQPTKISVLAEMADCSDQGARNILSDFEELGIVEKAGENPLKYDKNEAYFRFRRGYELAQTHSDEELRAGIVDRWNKHQAWKREFETEHPSTISIEQVQEEQGEEAVRELQEWSATYEALQDYIEALEQVRETKLILNFPATVGHREQVVQSNQFVQPFLQPFLQVQDTSSQILRQLMALQFSTQAQLTGLELGQMQSNILEYVDQIETTEQ
ncbi:DUF7342 family protein [Halopenitus persicus]|uniref:Uncharacterized protein n=1 Tax=Halopenitus persicus TaxID=1048396 RepID=A0A1H3P8W9_9EURY|nr:hypothetical protein [Halopenitus persicus]SDY97275.1 hypothetical protein SAMN05216564_1213 [Halopenitus persicus]